MRPPPPARPDPDARIAQLPGGPIDYTLRRYPRSRRLRVTLHPLRGVLVSVPPASRRGWARPEPIIDAFLAEREAWLRSHLDRQARERARIAATGGLRDGASIRYRGEFHRLRIDSPAGSAGGGLASAGRRRSRVTRIGGDSGDELVIELGAGDRRPLAAVLEGFFRARAAEAVERAVAGHAPALGVRPAALALRDPRSRWASASPTGRLMFSWRLVLAPAEALDTVVVHELAHLRVFGHGPAFWDLVASRRPDHATWRRWLRAHSAELHAALTEPTG